MATILIVDDHSVHRSFLLALLGEDNHRLLEAVDGQEALLLAAAEHPDLIITDIMMPRMDGNEFATRLRLDPALAAIPVIFYTSSYSTAEASVIAQQCGVRCVLQKPSPPQRIMAAVYDALCLPVPDRTSHATSGPMPGSRFATLDDAMSRGPSAIGAQAVPESSRTVENLFDKSLMDFQSLGSRLTALIDMGIELASEHDPQRLIEHGCRIARHIGVAKFSVAAIPNPEGDGYTCFSTRGVAPDMHARLAAMAPPRGMFDLVRTQRRAQRMQGLGGDAAAAGFSDGHPAVDSVLVAPIATADRDYGWIYLCDKLGGDRFGDIDEEVLSAVAAQIAVAYENMLLYERVKCNLAQLERDAAERQAITEQLQVSEAKFRQLAENINEVFFLIDPMSTAVFYISPAYEHVWGRSCASLYAQPQSWVDAIHPDDRARILDQVGHNGAADGEGPGFDYSYRIVQPSGAIRVIHARGFPIRDDAGEVYRIAGIAEDITEAERLREALQQREAGLQRAQQVSKLGHVVTAPDGAFISWSTTLPDLIGVDDKAMPPSTRDWLPIIHPDDRDKFRDCCISAGRTGLHHEIDYRAKRGDGNWVRLHQVLEPLTGTVTPDGKTRWFNTIQDVTEQKEQQEKLARLSRLYAVQSGVNSAIVRIHERMPLLREVSRIAVQLGAFSMAWVGLVGERSVDGRIINWLDDPVDRATNELILAAIRVGNAHPACRAARELRIVICNDVVAEPALAAVSATLCQDGHRAFAALPIAVDGRVVAVIALFAAEIGFFDRQEQVLLDEVASDLSFGIAFIEKEERLNFLACFDALTGLPNRMLFRDRLDQSLLELGQSRSIACVVMLDLARFSQINDVLGRNNGDTVLRMVAERLRGALAESASIARMVGDTFALLLSGLADGASAAAQVERMVLDPLEAAFVCEGKELVVHARAGLALFPNDGADAETLLKNAEFALKNAKTSGARVSFYSPQMNVASAARIELESALRAALAEQQFVLHYQPRVDLRSGRIVSAEALIRWQHPRRGLIPPTQFIAMCEETGLIVPIGAWVIEAVCAQQAAWRREGIEIVPVAVNLSALQFKKGVLMEAIAQARARHGLEQKYLEFELTESIVMDEPELAIRDMQALKAIGATLSLDDFGTGYSSLAYLQRFPFDFVKIDRSFVTDLTTNPGDAAIVTAVIGMAHSLKLQVVAEGVETEGQLRFLRRLRCDQLQGYYFSAGVAAAEFGAMLRDEKCLEFADAPAAREETLLILDDEPNNQSALNRLLRREGYRILFAGSGKEGLALLALNDVQVIVADQRMSGMSGTQFLAIVKDLYPDTIRIILSGYTDLEVVTDSVNRGAVFKFLTKPWDDDLLCGHIREAFRLYRPYSQAVAEMRAEIVD